MNLKQMQCNRFNRLASEANDRILTEREDKFVAKHRHECETCREAEDSLASSINLLRMTAFEAEPSEAYDDRLLRRLQVGRLKNAPPYWLPALVGAGIGAVCLFGLIQVIAGGSAAQPLTKPYGEARRVANPEFSEPRLILPTRP